ncbi:Major facilitator superfamily transporter [Pleurostoma richardsiae]|uniref:Major facilitator superfamily transporter n=1 Tax=Pleurostoma richardsiae TaxID=41990 RepID=A0AA38RAE4_9PEZI|nr:Major facilitator superfamily transporter [Pleurostoma richardsiae]
MGFLGRDARERKLEQPAVSVELVDESLCEEAPGWKPSTHELLVMLTLSVVSFMVALDACIIVTSLSSIVIDLGGDSTQGFWVGTAYLLANAVSMPFLAAISDIFGRPILLVASILFFTVGSAMCCSAHTMGVLLAGRSVQGIGGGGIIVLSLVIFTDIVPLRYRPKWYGTVQGAWGLGNCIGPIVGGAIAQNTSWRWVFYIMFPFCGFGLATIPFLLTLKPRTETMGEKLARVDWIGGFIFVSSATSFLIAISWGGSQFPWNSAQTLAPLIIGAFGLGGTYAWERYGAREPFLRHSLFNSISAVATFFCAAAQGLVIFGQLYYVPFYFLSILAYSPVKTGLALFPVAFTLVPGSILTGVLVTRFNNFRVPIWVGWVVLTAGCGATVAWGRDTSVAVWVVTLVVLGLGHGAILNAQNFACQAMCADGEEGSAAAMYGFLRHFSTALGVGVGGSTFQNVMARRLRALNLPAAIARDAEAFVPRLLAMPRGDATRWRIEGAYVAGFRGVFAVYLGVSGLALLLSLAIRHFDMNKEIGTEHTLEGNRFARMVDQRLGSGGRSVSPTLVDESEREAEAKRDSLAPRSPVMRKATPEPYVGT